MPSPSMHNNSLAARPATDYTSPDYWNGLIKMGLSKFFILCVLYKQPLHGYEIAKRVESVTRGCCSPGEGTIYPGLRDFEAGGYVTVETEIVQGRERKVYALTDLGREAFRVAVGSWMGVTRCLQESHEMLVRDATAEVQGACRP